MAELNAPSQVARKCLLVLGMHRSGTSAMTRVLNLMGAALPGQLLPAASDNPDGFWEGSRFMQLHDEALAAAGVRWFDPVPLPQAFFSSADAALIEKQLAALLRTDFPVEPLYAIKDPRICRLVPLWRRVLDSADSAAMPILVIRDPQEVAQSLLARNGLPISVGHLLWLRHVLEAEAATRDLPRSIVFYGSLLDDWRSVLGQINADLRIWPDTTPQKTIEIDGFLSSARRHQVATGSEPISALDADWVRPVYQALRGGEISVLDRVRQEIDLADQRYGEPLRSGASWSEPDLAELISGLATAKTEIAALRQRAKYAGDQAARAQSELAAIAAHHVNSSNALVARYDALADLYNDVLASSSWRMTKPVRSLMHGLKGGSEIRPEQHLSVGGAGTVPDIDRLADQELITWSGLWQPDYYLASHPIPPDAEPLEHFLDFGAAEGFRPNPWFDTKFYVANNPRSAVNGENPLVDYIKTGAWDGPDPHPAFKTERYLESHPQLRARHMTPLAHFLRYELPAGAAQEPVTDLPVLPRALHALAPLDPGEGWMWQRLHGAGALVLKHSETPDLATDLFGTATRAKILFSSHELSRTGAPLILLALVKLVARRIDAELIVFSDRGGELLDDFAEFAHVLLADRYLPFAAGAGIADITTILAKLAGAPPMIACCNTANSEHYARCFKQRGIPVLCLVHEAAVPYAPDQIRRLFDSVDRIVFPSLYVQETMRAKIGDRANTGLVLSQGLLKPELLDRDTGPPRSAIRGELQLAPSTRIILTCGTMDLRKGVDLFVQVALKVLGQGVSDVSFVWVGNGGSDRTQPAWWARYDALAAGFGDRVRFVGARLDTADWYLAADLFLLTSREDPMPCVVHEAMAAGLPVVAFEGGGGASEAIGETGMTVHYADVDAMAEAVLTLLDNPEQRLALGRAARVRVRDVYDFGRYADRLLDIGETLGVVLPKN